MLTSPLIFESHSDNTRCDFQLKYTTDTAPTAKLLRSNLFLNILAPTNPKPIPEYLKHEGEYERGWVAIRHTLDRSWNIVQAAVFVRQPVHRKDVDIFCITIQPSDAIAVGVDSRMTREDIVGATITYEENGKILFAHATEEEHHDRILLAETAISVVFEELLMDRLIRMDVVDIAGRSTANRRGELTILAHINDFRNDCMKMARWSEGQLHIGEHVKNPEEHYIYKMVEKAFALAKKKWKAEKSAELNQISDRIAGIEKRLKSRHTFKRRWEIPQVFPNAQQQTQTESGSDS